MSTHLQKPTRSKRRRAIQLHGLDEQPKPRHKAPSASDAILAWLLWLPIGSDPRQEARRELEHMAKRDNLPPKANELKRLLQKIATSETPPP